MNRHTGDMGDLSRQLDVDILMVAIFQGDLFVTDEQVASLLACGYCDLCGGRCVFDCWEGEVGEVVAAHAIEIVSAGRETGGYELLVVVGGELLDTATCLIEDVEAGL